MKPFTQREKKSVFIELTPLIDVIFILLLFFILTSSFSDPAVALNLPAGKNRQTPRHTELSVSLQKDGGLFLNGEAVTRDELQKQLVAGLPEIDDHSVILKGDGGVMYEDLFALMDFLKTCGVEQINLANKRASGGNGARS